MPHGALTSLERPSELEWEDALRRLDATQQDVSLQFQPIFDLADGQAVGYEALARFPAPPRSGPAEWLAAAARHGIAEQLETRAVEGVLERRHGLAPGCFLAVNVSPGALSSGSVLEQFAQAGALDRVVIELTEQTPVRDFGVLRAALRPLRDAGARVAIDDAGVGCSGLLQIVEIEPDLVKIDRSLIARADICPARSAAIEAVTLLCRRIGARAVGEGVEHPAELAELRRCGVQLAQGFLLGRPGPLPVV